MMRDDDPEIIGPEIIGQAIRWHVRQAEMDDEAWSGFVAWLEQHPAHARAYDRIAATDRLLVAPESVAAPANDDRPVRRRWLFPVGGAMAAAIALALALPMIRQPTAQTYLVKTEPGQRRTVRLAGGTSIDLSGATRLRLDRSDPRFASLEAGEALFTIRHEAAHPFTVRSGDLTIRDLGTVFNLMRSGARLDVQLSEGSALFEPGPQAVRLQPGDGLIVREDLRRITKARIPVESIGAWRSGMLRFQDDRLPAVTEAIRRAYGTVVVLEGDLPTRSFTGSVRFVGAADRDIPHLAAVIGVQWRRQGDQWILAPRSFRQL